MANTTVANYYTLIGRKIHDYQDIRITNPQKLDLLNEGYLDFVLRTMCTRKRGRVAILEKVATYTLPTDNIQILRAEYNDGDEIQTRQTDWMDEHKGFDWRRIDTENDRIESLIQDNEVYTDFRISPIQKTFGFIISTDDDLLKMDYNDSGTDTDVEIANGAYTTIALFLTAIEEAIGDAFTVTDPSVTYSTTTGKITIDPDGSDTISYTELGSTAGRWIGFYADIADATTITSDTGIKNITFDYIYEPSELSDDADFPAFPSEYHRALFYYAMREIMENAPTDMADYNVAQYYKNEYMNLVKKCKRRISKGLIRNRQPHIYSPGWI